MQSVTFIHSPIVLVRLSNSVMMDDFNWNKFIKSGLVCVQQLRARYLSLIGLAVFVTVTLLIDQVTIKSLDLTFGLDDQEKLTKSSTTIFTVKSSLLHDKTIFWDPSIDRMWLDDIRPERRPPAMILLTSYGWNRADQSDALENYSRQTRESELLDGIINHPWFHPTAWDDIENGDNVTIQSILGLEDNEGDGDGDGDLNHTTIAMRFYIFFDLSSNCEVHYPLYHSFDKNLDTSGGRVNVSSNIVHQSWAAVHHPIWQSRFITQLGARNLNQVKLIYFDCNAEMHPDFAETRRTKGVPVVDVHMTATISRSDESIDMGLVPPLLNRAVALNETEIENIYNCVADYDDTQRPYYITYIGNFRSGPIVFLHVGALPI